MRNTITLFNKRTGRTVTGYTVKIYSYSHISVTTATVTNFTAKYTMTGLANGTYYADVTLTFKGSVVITTPADTYIIPVNLLGVVYQGDNQITINPST